jgi:Zn-dependent peptidase ImmA (M78 family)/DNA-binding XRE family transcriptional regulator
VVVGLRLAEARKSRGVTQEGAAAHLGCSRPTLIATEKGIRPAKPDEIVKLAALYGRSVHEIVRPGAPDVALAPHLRSAIEPSRGDSEALECAINALERWATDYRELERLAGARPFESYPPQVELPSRVRLQDFAEDVALRERAWLHTGDQPILNLRRLLEYDVGLRIFCEPLPSQVAGLYASAADAGYCILLNRKHRPERQRFTLAHEYGHFLCDRHKPGVDYLAGEKRRPANERFADAFAISFLVPRTSLRRYFLDTVARTNDFRVEDLCQLSSIYGVSVQAMTLRLEELGLVPRGTSDWLREKGFRPAAAKDELGLAAPAVEGQEPYPERYKYLAVEAFRQGKISEGQLANFLRCDRVSAREVVEECVTRWETDREGREEFLRAPVGGSLLAGPACDSDAEDGPAALNAAARITPG